MFCCMGMGSRYYGLVGGVGGCSTDCTHPPEPLHPILAMRDGFVDGPIAVPAVGPLSLIRASAEACSPNCLFPDFVSILHLPPGAAGLSFLPKPQQTSGCGKERGRTSVEESSGSAVWEQHPARGSWSCSFSPIPAPLPPSPLLSRDAFVSPRTQCLSSAP